MVFHSLNSLSTNTIASPMCEGKGQSSSSSAVLVSTSKNVLETTVLPSISVYAIFIDQP